MKIKMAKLSDIFTSVEFWLPQSELFQMYKAWVNLNSDYFTEKNILQIQKKLDYYIRLAIDEDFLLLFEIIRIKKCQLNQN